MTEVIDGRNDERVEEYRWVLHWRMENDRTDKLMLETHVENDVWIEEKQRWTAKKPNYNYVSYLRL